ncbi:MAG: hypothetical protein V4857_26935 [Pseudomonadota bacterium]
MVDQPMFIKTRKMAKSPKKHQKHINSTPKSPKNDVQNHLAKIEISAAIQPKNNNWSYHISFWLVQYNFIGQSNIKIFWINPLSSTDHRSKLARPVAGS